MKKSSNASLAAIILAFLSFGSFTAQAQIAGFGEDVRYSGYSTGIGVRTGTQAGLTLKQFIGQRSAIEAIVSTSLVSSKVTRAINATVLWERHQNIADIRGFMWFFGAGGHIGFHNEDGNRTLFSRDGDGFIGLGLDAILGLEYKIPVVPITIGADIKPAFDLRGRSQNTFFDAALSARVVF